MHDQQHQGYDPRRSYWGQSPHLVNHLRGENGERLSAQAKALWLYLLEWWGLHAGACALGTRGLAEGAGISLGAVVQAKRDLRAAGLIAWEERSNGPGAQPTHVLIPCDIWLTNQVAFRDRNLQPGEMYDQPHHEVNREIPPAPAAAFAPSPVHHLNRGVHQAEHAEESETPAYAGVAAAAPAREAPPAKPPARVALAQPALPGLGPRTRAKAAPRPPSPGELVKRAFRDALTEQGAMPHFHNFADTIGQVLALVPPPTLEEVDEAARSLLADIGGPREGKTTYVWFEKLPDKLRSLRARARREQARPADAPPLPVGSYQIDTEGFA